MPDATRSYRQAGLLGILARRTGLLDQRPSELSEVMERQHETDQTPYAQRRAEANAELLESLRVEETGEMIGPWRVLRPVDERKLPEEADTVRDEEEI